MGIFTDGETPGTQAANDANTVQTKTGDAGSQENGFPTDVEGVNADDMVKNGIDEFPCFEVPENEFYQTMRDGRKRLRFTGNAQKYMQGTRYKRPFYIRTTDNNGKKYVRKIK